MSPTLVTGASGLIGAAVTRALLDRGDDVRVTVRPGADRGNLAGLDVEVVQADLLDRRALRRALRDVGTLFHTAGSTSLRASAADLFAVNVKGTRVVLEEALSAGVDRVVHTSSVAAIGPAPRDRAADETQLFEGQADRLGLPFVSAKHEAEREALGAAARGLDVVIVNPGQVMGPGDHHPTSTEVVRRFLRQEIPAYVDGALCLVDVEDVARGHLLAAAHGRSGERYILGGRNFTLDRLFADLGRLSGVEPPAVKLPLPAALALARGLEALPGRPIITQTEVLAASGWWAFRSAKARRELGYRPRPHEETLERTIAWWRDREGRHAVPPGTRQPVALRLAGFGVDRAERLARAMLPL